MLLKRSHSRYSAGLPSPHPLPFLAIAGDRATVGPKSTIYEPRETLPVQSDKASGLLKGTPLFLGRSLLGLYFLLPGAAKFLDWDRHVTLMDTHQMPLIPVLLATAGVLQIIGGICLLVNRQVLIAALGLAAMVVLINLNLHDFWNLYEGVNPEREAQNFSKNLGIFAGLLVLAAVNMGDKQSP